MQPDPRRLALRRPEPCRRTGAAGPVLPDLRRLDLRRPDPRWRTHAAGPASSPDLGRRPDPRARPDPRSLRAAPGEQAPSPLITFGVNTSAPQVPGRTTTTWMSSEPPSVVMSADASPRSVNVVDVVTPSSTWPGCGYPGARRASRHPRDGRGRSGRLPEVRRAASTRSWAAFGPPHCSAPGSSPPRPVARWTRPAGVGRLRRVGTGRQLCGATRRRQPDRLSRSGRSLPATVALDQSLRIDPHVVVCVAGTCSRVVARGRRSRCCRLRRWTVALEQRPGIDWHVVVVCTAGTSPSSRR